MGGICGGGSKDVTSTSTVQLPAWMDTAAQDLLKRAQSRVDTTSYPSYPVSARVEPFSAPSLAAFNLAGTETGTNIGSFLTGASPTGGAGSVLPSGGGTPLTAANLENLVPISRILSDQSSFSKWLPTSSPSTAAPAPSANPADRFGAWMAYNVAMDPGIDQSTFVNGGPMSVVPDWFDPTAAGIGPTTPTPAMPAGPSDAEIRALYSNPEFQQAVIQKYGLQGLFGGGTAAGGGAPSAPITYNPAGATGQPAWMDEFRRGVDLAGTASSPFSQADINAYFNPYTSTVIDQTVKELERQHQIDTLRREDSYASRGSYLNEERTRALGNEANRNFEDTLAKAVGNLNYQGFADAMAQFNAQKNREGNLAGTFLKAADQRQIAGGRDISTLLGIGQTQENKGQTQRDLAYQEFLNAFNYPGQQFEWLLNFLSMTPHGQTTTATNPVGTPNILGQTLGAATAFKGLGGFDWLNSLGAGGGGGGMNPTAAADAFASDPASLQALLNTY